MSKFKMAAIVALCAAAALSASNRALQAPSMTPGAHDPKLIEDLVYANRILSDQGVVDAFGHVSVRDDTDPTCFLLARSIAPALVTTSDILVFDRNGEPIDDGDRA